MGFWGKRGALGWAGLMKRGSCTLCLLGGLGCEDTEPNEGTVYFYYDLDTSRMAVLRTKGQDEVSVVLDVQVIARTTYRLSIESECKVRVQLPNGSVERSVPFGDGFHRYVGPLGLAPATSFPIRATLPVSSIAAREDGSAPPLVHGSVTFTTNQGELTMPFALSMNVPYE